MKVRERGSPMLLWLPACTLCGACAGLVVSTMYQTYGWGVYVSARLYLATGGALLGLLGGVLAEVCLQGVVKSRFARIAIILAFTILLAVYLLIGPMFQEARE